MEGSGRRQAVPPLPPHCPTAPASTWGAGGPFSFSLLTGPGAAAGLVPAQGRTDQELSLVIHLLPEMHSM